MFQRKGLKCLTTKVCFPSSLQARNKLLPIILMFSDGIDCFPGPPYHIQVDPSVTQKQTPCQPIPVHLKEVFKKEIVKILQAGVLKPLN